MWAPPLPWNLAEAGQPVPTLRGTAHIIAFLLSQQWAVVVVITGATTGSQEGPRRGSRVAQAGKGAPGSAGEGA